MAGGRKEPSGPILERIAELGRLCGDAGVPWALGGGHAANRYRSEARATVDIDLFVDAPPEVRDRIEAELVERGWDVRRFPSDDSIRTARRGDHERLDLLYSETDLEREVIDRAQGADTRSGVILVPAFQGLASPWWNPHARAAVMGLDASSDDSDVCLAALEAICFQVKHVLDDMKTDGAVRVDGGLARSDHFLQLQADILARPVIRSAHPELTAYGIARMAGVGAGLWAGDTTESTEDDTHFEPRETMRSNLDERYQAWCRAVELCLEVRK